MESKKDQAFVDINGTIVEMPVELTHGAMATWINAGRKHMAEELIDRMVAKIADERGLPELTSDELDEMHDGFEKAWTSVDKGFYDSDGFGALVINGALHRAVEEEYDNLLEKRKHYYKVVYCVSQEVVAWIKASDSSEAYELARGVSAYELDDAELICVGDMDADMQYVEVADDEYCGEEIIAE